MSKKQVSQLKPFLSVVIIISTLFVVVFFKMEVRRMGYSVLKKTQDYKALKDEYRMQVMKYAKVTRPERVKRLAVSKLTLNDAQNGQIIQLTDGRIAIPQ